MGHAYGRKMMKGHLAVRGFRVSEASINESLKRVCPDGHQACRSNTINRLNPIHYQANYFGHKLHIDQNEKLVAFGITRDCKRWFFWESSQLFDSTHKKQPGHI